MAVGKAQLPEFKAIEGMRLGVTCAGIKKPGKKDLVVIEIAQGSACAGVFTRNAFCAAPVQLCKARLESSIAEKGPAYFLINTGNANAGTGEQGMRDAQECCSELARLAGCDQDSVLPFSTGVIGEKLPVERITSGLPSALAALDCEGWSGAAEGILTTDTRSKGVTASVSYGGETLSISGISKGAGMIKPNMATMLGFIATDAGMSETLCRSLIKELSESSFNRITVDGDTSTNDACMLVATGQSSAPDIDTAHPDFPAFKQCLKDVFTELAQAIVRDGEGATKFVSVVIEQASSQEEALSAAYTIAHSPLIKTALFASDPNWGRILAALGRAPIQDLDLSLVDIYLGSTCIVKRGEKNPQYTEAAGQAEMDREEITIRVMLGRGQYDETVWTTDLSHDYIKINAEYRT
ncbi:MAG: bifunctional ornithine acetyltransferase/N-acetylglutamate synthase [Oleiphilus sp.]|nr:MAG: bifunctional ornithine acetyltransferase/N-acetylglutamate synthase [Oleiphilus sp.]